MTRYYISIWDLHREIENLTLNDSLRPRNYDKGPQWLGKRIKELPRSSDISTAAYRLRQLEYRALWQGMAKEHEQVVSTLMNASTSTSIRGYDCFFYQAMLQMVTFLDHFATRAAPLSVSGNDQFEILMDNFSTVIDTVCIFYDRFDCEGRSETLRIERDQGRDEKWVFCFVKNERQPPLHLSEILRILNKEYSKNHPPSPPAFRPTAAAPPRNFYNSSEDFPGCQNLTASSPEYHEDGGGGGFLTASPVLPGGMDFEQLVAMALSRSPYNNHSEDSPGCQNFTASSPEYHEDGGGDGLLMGFEELLDDSMWDQCSPGGPDEYRFQGTEMPIVSRF